MTSEFGLRGPKTPWVCPSDRQLALRAKLRAGWSVKTNQFNTFPKPQPLTEKEHQAIVSVIQKAEELDLNEQYRVGKLVDRLESLRRLASGNGITQCVLCGDSFGLSVFGRNSYRCFDCKKAVCRKCVVDLSTAGPSTTSGAPGPKDSILRLCKLCSENREFIKKSGAWFYKGVPKYVLPEKKHHSASYSYESPSTDSSYPEKRYMSRYIPDTRGANLQPGNKRAGWYWPRNTKTRSQSEPEYESSSGEEEQPGSSSGGAGGASGSATKRAGSLVKTTEKPSHKSTLKRLMDSKSSRSADETTVLSEEHFFEMSDPSSTQGSSGHRQKYFERFDPSDPTLSSSADNNSRSSVSSSDGAIQSTTGTQRSNSASVIGFGVLEVSILYDDSHQALHCSIHRAKELTPTDINGLSDPYCMLKLIPTRSEGTHLRTKTVHKTLHPVFNETLTFQGVTQNDLTRQILQIDVLDEDRWGKDCLGSVQIPLLRIRPQQTRSFTLHLEKARFTEEKEWGRGRLLLSLSFVAEKNILLVGVIRAEGLPALDHNGTSDPFVKVKLLHDANMGSLSSNSFSANRKFKTSVKWKTLNPEFREEFSLKVCMVDLPKLALAVAVFDRDLGNNYLGGILLSASSKGERLKHWTDMMKIHNTKHMRWHTLSPSLLPQ